MAQRPVLEFWYDFASTYSYLSAMRVEQVAAAVDVRIVWRPFLLGPIFASQGWTTSPFNILPGKGRYMWRDMEREAVRLNLPFYRSAVFPQNSLLAARLALSGVEPGWVADFTRRVFTEEFGNGRDIADRDMMAGILGDLGLDADIVLADAESDHGKRRLYRVGEEAQARGIFGAPAFVAEDGELFWGNDRLERALEWASQRARCGDAPA